MKPVGKKVSWLPARKDKRFWKTQTRKAARQLGKKEVN